MPGTDVGSCALGALTFQDARPYARDRAHEEGFSLFGISLLLAVVGCGLDDANSGDVTATTAAVRACDLIRDNEAAEALGLPAAPAPEDDEGSSCKYENDAETDPDTGLRSYVSITVKVQPFDVVDYQDGIDAGLTAFDGLGDKAQEWPGF